MSGKYPSPIVRVLPSLTDVAFVLPVIFLFARLGGMRHLLGDGDTGWHVRAGEWMLDYGRILDHDIFSFTKPGEPWHAWEWLWELCFAWLHRHFGMEAVAVTSLIVICLASAVLFRLSSWKSGNRLVAIAVTCIALSASVGHWLARPHLLTLLFIVVTLTILERVQSGSSPKLLYAMGPMMLLWVNLHAGFFIGLLAIGCFAVGQLVRAATSAEANSRQDALHGIRPYVWTLSGCLAISFANPFGYKLHTHIAEYLRGSEDLRRISEFQSFDFQSPIAIYFEVLIVLGAAAAFTNFVRRQFAQAFLILGFMHLAFVANRNVTLYSFVVAPYICEILAAGLRRIEELEIAHWVKSFAGSLDSVAKESNALDEEWRLHLPSLAVLALITALIYDPPSGTFKAEFDPKAYPESALSVLQTFGPEARIFSGDEWGDYLIYKMYPSARVFVDGRSDFYGPQIGKDLHDIASVHHSWESILRKYAIDTIVIPPSIAIAGALKATHSWRLVYDDGVALIFRSAGPRENGKEDSAWSTAAIRRNRAIARATPEHETENRSRSNDDRLNSN